MKPTERIVNKLTSGQWILAVSGAFVFAWCAANKIIPPEAITALLGVVFQAYFGRRRNGELTTVTTS